jgi:Zn-finger nucleic acid-binding protein
MKLDHIEIIQLELKYCERCGGLWLRPLGADQVYCPPCIPKMMEFSAGKCKSRVHLPDDNARETPGLGTNPAPWCAEGGNA